jgi:D-alanine-D-alanine ligase
MRGPRILILHNEPVLPASHPDADSEHEVLFTVDMVSKALIQAGLTVTRLGASHDCHLLWSRLQEDRPDAVFNLYEGTADNGNTETYVAGLLEWLGLPFTGSPSQALGLARHKHLAKYLLRGAALPTPEFFVVDHLPAPKCPLPWPVIVKPALQDASEGIDHASVVTDQQQLEERIRYLLDRYTPPVLVEEFVGSREFNIAVIEVPHLQVLPFSEIVFTGNEPGCWPIMTYDAKWKPGTRDFETVVPRLPADISPELAGRLERLACQAFRVLGCRDYARVDIRLDGAGTPFIIEVNPNPDISPLAGLATALETAGLSYERFNVDLVRTALARGGAGPDTENGRPSNTGARRSTPRRQRDPKSQRNRGRRRAGGHGPDAHSPRRGSE